MRPTALLATLPLILFIRLINGHQNGIPASGNFKSSNDVSQMQPYVANDYKTFLNNNGNTVPIQSIANQYEILRQTNTLLQSPSTQQIQLPPDLKPQPLQVQQHLQLQKPLPLQLSLPLESSQTHVHKHAPSQVHEALQSKPLIQGQVPIQSQQAVHLQTKPATQSQSQDVLKLQSQLQGRPQVQAQPQVPIHSQMQAISQLQSQPPLQPSRGLSTQINQHSQTKEIAQPNVHLVTLQPPQSTILLQEPHTIKQQVQPQQNFQPTQALHLDQTHQTFGFQQNFPPKPVTLSETTKLLESTIIQPRYNYQPNSQLNVNLQSSNPQTALNIEKPNFQNLNANPQQNSVISPVEVLLNLEKSSEYNQEIPSLKYYLASQQLPSSIASSVSVQDVSNAQSFAKTPNHNIPQTEDSHVSLIVPPNYNLPIPVTQPSIPETVKSAKLISPSSSIITIPSSQLQSTNTQTYYYNPQAVDPRHNPYINHNSGHYYNQQFPITVLQSQPTALLPSQPSIISSMPISTIQAPSVSLQYASSSGYPINTIVAPSYTNQKPKSPNLKSFLPLIFNLLKEKIASCACRDDCACECKNKDINNELEVSSGYSSQKYYGVRNCNDLSVLDTVSEEMEGSECPRKRKNCKKNLKTSIESSDETQEEEDSDEEDADEDDVEDED